MAEVGVVGWERAKRGGLAEVGMGAGAGTGTRTGCEWRREQLDIYIQNDILLKGLDPQSRPHLYIYCGGGLWITLRGFHMKTKVILVTMYSYLVIIVSNRGAGGVNGLSFV